VLFKKGRAIMLTAKTRKQGADVVIDVPEV